MDRLGIDNKNLKKTDVTPTLQSKPGAKDPKLGGDQDFISIGGAPRLDKGLTVDKFVANNPLFLGSLETQNQPKELQETPLIKTNILQQERRSDLPETSLLQPMDLKGNSLSNTENKSLDSNGGKDPKDYKLIPLGGKYYHEAQSTLETIRSHYEDLTFLSNDQGNGGSVINEDGLNRALSDTTGRFDEQTKTAIRDYMSNDELRTFLEQRGGQINNRFGTMELDGAIGELDAARKGIGSGISLAKSLFEPTFTDLDYGANHMGNALEKGRSEEQFVLGFTGNAEAMSKIQPFLNLTDDHNGSYNDEVLKMLRNLDTDGNGVITAQEHQDFQKKFGQIPTF